MAGIADDIKKQRQIAEQSKLKIEKLKEKEARRILRIADKVGFFDVEISDEMLKNAFSEMIEAARAPVAKAAK